MDGPGIRYTVSMPRPATHLLHVTVEIDAPSDTTELRIPVWIPGSYLVREFARHVQDFRATDSLAQPLAWRKTRKDTWLIEAGSAPTIRAEFDYYANELTVRTSHLDSTHVFFNPPNLLPYAPGRTAEPALLTVEAPDGWTVETGLRRCEPGRNVFIASDYDELADCPVHAGPDPVLSFDALGVPHAVATWGRGNLDQERLRNDLQRIVESEAALFDGFPYERFLFILLLTEGTRGGLEHRNSTAVTVPRFSFRPGRSYERVLQLLTHEFFHTWNVKRIQPEGLGDLDYARENYTRSLWVAEGTTEYYTSLLLCRAGLITSERYLEIIGQQMSDLADTPGRLHQSLEEASFDTWIKHYRPDEHTVNSSVSYYLKGAVASLLLDLEIRRQTAGQRSLDDVMRHLWHQYGQAGRSIPDDGYQSAVEAVSPGDWTPFFDHVVRGRDDLACAPALATIGIDVAWRADPNAAETWIGIRTRSEGGRTRVANVLAGGPAWDAGISAGDELLALDGLRLDDSGLDDRLRDYGPGDCVHVAIFRGDELVVVPVTLAKRPATQAILRRNRQATVRQRTMYEGWLRAPWTPG
ncbi:MAG: PDZ domain-containing protein [Chloroflexi bacterium]|nr:PDZ domain-containing protein [Chloroflexota bacterium]